MSDGMIAVVVSVWVAGSLGIASYAQGQGRSYFAFLLLALLISWVVVFAFLWFDKAKAQAIPAPAYVGPTASGAVAVTQGRAIGIELVFSFLIPIAGIVFAVMRFTKEEIGPGLACVLMAFVGASFWSGLSIMLSLA